MKTGQKKPLLEGRLKRLHGLWRVRGASVDYEERTKMIKEKTRYKKVVQKKLVNISLPVAPQSRGDILGHSVVR